MSPSAKFSLRVRHAGTDPVHGARSKTGGRTAGYVTACWLWLHPGDPHTWCTEDAEITCIECIERMGPTALEYPIPGTVGTLQQRLAEVIENEVPTGYSELATQRIAETIEMWRQDTEGRIRMVVDEALADLIPDTTRFGTTRLLAEKVLRSMDVGDSAASEEVKK